MSDMSNRRRTESSSSREPDSFDKNTSQKVLAAHRALPFGAFIVTLFLSVMSEVPTPHIYLFYYVVNIMSGLSQKQLLLLEHF